MAVWSWIALLARLSSRCQGLAVSAARWIRHVPWLSLLSGWPAWQWALATALFLPLLLLLLLLSVSLRSGNPPEWVYGFWGQTHFMVGAATKAWKETRHWEDTVLIQTIPPPRCFWLSLFSITSFFFLFSSFLSLSFTPFFALEVFFPNKKHKKAHSAQVKNAVFIAACLA